MSTSSNDDSSPPSRILENEEEMQKLNDTNTVPPEIKQWLLTTFYNNDGTVRQGKFSKNILRTVNFCSNNVFGRAFLNITSCCCCCCVSKGKAQLIARRITIATSNPQSSVRDRADMKAVQQNHIRQGAERVLKREQDRLRSFSSYPMIKNSPTTERLTFRSIVTAIQAGIALDRIFKRTRPIHSTCSSLIPIQLKSPLEKVNTWEFDQMTIEYNNTSPLKWIMLELFSQYDIPTRFCIETPILLTFFDQLVHGYEVFKNPYHNSRHAADVVQTLHFLINYTGLIHWLTELEILAMLIAAAGHDFEHTGRTNDFHIHTRSDLAVLYNDKSPLENHHVSALFSILQNDNMNILTGLTREEYREFRSLVIEMILGTDMKMHFDQLQCMRLMMHGHTGSHIDKRKAMSLILHCADISNPMKPFDIHQRWTARLVEEYFQQGDDEAKIGLPISPMMDRSKTLIPQSQISFVNIIVLPAFTVLHDMFDLITNEILIEFEKSKAVGVESSNNEDVFQATQSTDTVNTSRSQDSTNKPTEKEKMLSWVEVRRQSKPHDEFRSVEIVEVKEIVGRLKAFRLKLENIMNNNRENWEKIQEQEAVSQDV